jgi:hypothetical protein
LPVLTHILVTADHQGTRLAVTDLDHWLETRISEQPADPECFLIPTEAMEAACRADRGSSVAFTPSGGRRSRDLGLVVQSGGIEATSVFPTLDPKEFPARPALDGTRFGLQLNAPNTPSAGASKLVAEGSLSFVALDNKATLEHGEVKLTTGETVQTEAAQLKFSKGNGPGGEGEWWMELRPSPEALDVAVKLFGDDEKVPLFDSDGGRTATRTMNGVVSYGFQCPAGKLSRVEIAYAKKGDQIKVPFKVEIGLGDFSGVEQDQGPRRPGPGPRPKPNTKPKGVI